MEKIDKIINNMEKRIDKIYEKTDEIIGIKETKIDDSVIKAWYRIKGECCTTVDAILVLGWIVSSLDDRVSKLENPEEEKEMKKDNE